MRASFASYLHLHLHAVRVLYACIQFILKYFQMNDKDSPSETEADTTDQLASKQQHPQSKLLLAKEQQTSGSADDAQLQSSDALQSPSQQNKLNAPDAFYPEANFVNASDSQVSTQQEHELETRLK